MTDLTEQWKKGELDIGEVYYVKTERGVYKANGEYLNSASCIYGFDISYIIAPVPTYSEYLALQSDSLAKNEGAEIVAELKAKVKQLKNGYKDLAYKFRSYQDFNDLETLRLEEENAKLKELLKVCRKWIGVERDFAVPNEKIILQQLLIKIDEVLK